MIDLSPEASERRTLLIANLRNGEAGNAFLELLEEELRGLERVVGGNSDYRLGEIHSMRRMIDYLQAEYVGPPEEEIAS